MERTVPRRLVWAACVLLASCGKQAPSPPHAEGAPAGAPAARAPNLSTPEAALAFASHALDEGDFDALRACSTAQGLEGVRRDLLTWNALLADETAGRRFLSRLPPARTDADNALYRAGFAGDPAALLHMLVRTRASDAGPVARPAIAEPHVGIERIEADRPFADGTRRRVVLVLRGGVWLVDRLTL